MSSHYLDVAIGLSFTFLAVSLLCSATREAIASLFQTRARVLLDAVLTMLHEPAGRPRVRGVRLALRRLCRSDGGFGLERLGEASLAAAVMRHPLIVGLAQRGRMPSYIPAPIFARAVVSTLVARHGQGQDQRASALLASTGNDGLVRTLRAIMGAGPDDLAALEEAVRIWYETVMDRTTGWYKRRSQCVLFLVGLCYACAMNIDALMLSQRLWQDSSVAAALARQGEQGMASAPLQGGAGQLGVPAAGSAVAGGPVAPPLALTLNQALAAQTALGQVAALPIGWPAERFARLQHEHERGAGTMVTLAALALSVLGWVATAFASSLGAPFWFDGVGWLLALRGTGARPVPDAAAGSKAAGITLPGLAPAGAGNQAGSAAAMVMRSAPAASDGREQGGIP